MKTQDILWRLKNLDEWFNGDQWWRELFNTHKKIIKQACLDLVDRLELLGSFSDAISSKQFAVLFNGVFQPELSIHPHMQEELIALLFKDDHNYQKEVCDYLQ
ncbi:hypothetical protein HN858_03575 [Candidatus Falkowbacteria bacterium]|nr:hypothetical protein [Candidatus Falkowbacteria bacterium]MBT6574123.1 hypothetical protein [Candidatus Falkowbacteria bacterium]MBT7348730.1 hypothetical protein [Candidatus Falkowbacteria bacterium]MBT7500520.1 hypothetical protein [Candidatus Falkowbacteria bacterium]